MRRGWFGWGLLLGFGLLLGVFHGELPLLGFGLGLLFGFAGTTTAALDGRYVSELSDVLVVTTSE
jgi:hypothetical protein